MKKRSAQYPKHNFKYWVELPKFVEEAYIIDTKNGNTFWADAIPKEMKDVRVTFNILPKGQHAPIGINI